LTPGEPEIIAQRINDPECDGAIVEPLSDFIEKGCKDAKLCTGNFFGLYLTLVLFHYRAY
jgi:hypothetical protein